jgi:hypothetical protein
VDSWSSTAVSRLRELSVFLAMCRLFLGHFFDNLITHVCLGVRSVNWESFQKCKYCMY